MAPAGEAAGIRRGAGAGQCLGDDGRGVNALLRTSGRARRCLRGRARADAAEDGGTRDLKAAQVLSMRRRSACVSAQGAAGVSVLLLLLREAAGGGRRGGPGAAVAAAVPWEEEVLLAATGGGQCYC